MKVEIPDSVIEACRKSNADPILRGRTPAGDQRQLASGLAALNHAAWLGERLCAAVRAHDAAIELQTADRQPRETEP